MRGAHFIGFQNTGRRNIEMEAGSGKADNEYYLCGDIGQRLLIIELCRL